jgi:hypothetical protein
MSLLEFGEYLVKHPQYGERVKTDTAAASATIGTKAGGVNADSLGAGASAEAKAGGDWVSKWLVPNLKKLVGMSVEAMAMAIDQQREQMKASRKTSREGRNVQRSKPRKGQHINDGMELNQQLALFAEGSEEEGSEDDEMSRGGKDASSTQTDGDELAELHEAMLTSKEPAGRGRGGGGVLTKDIHSLPKKPQSKKAATPFKTHGSKAKGKEAAEKVQEKELTDKEAGKDMIGKEEAEKSEETERGVEDGSAAGGSSGGSTSGRKDSSRRRSTTKDDTGKAGVKKWKRPPPAGLSTPSTKAAPVPASFKQKPSERLQQAQQQQKQQPKFGRLPANSFELLGYAFVHISFYSNHHPPLLVLCSYDFMMDENMKLQLIEVNSNPCMDRVGPHLQKMLPEMIEHIFQLALDPIFPSPLQAKKEEESAAAPVDKEGAAEGAAEGAGAAVAAAAEPQVETKKDSARARAKAKGDTKSGVSIQPGKRNLMQQGAFGMSEFRQQQRQRQRRSSLATAKNIFALVYPPEG